MNSSVFTANSDPPSVPPTGNVGDEAVADGARRSVYWAHPGDEAALLALFARAFGHEMPPAQWRWKYAGLDPIGTLVRREGACSPSTAGCRAKFGFRARRPRRSRSGT